MYCHCHSISSFFLLIYSLALLYLPFLKVLLSTTSFLSTSLHLSEEMGRAKIGFCCHRNRQLIISLLFILVSSSTLVRFTAEGRAITKLLEAAPEKGVEEEKIAVKAQTIGSRPPRCDKRCNSCEHCEAVQVPIATQAHSRKRSRFSAAISNIAYSRGDGISNYKPMSWKCKCGNLIFNP